MTKYPSDSPENVPQNAFPRIPEASLEERSELKPSADRVINCVCCGKVTQKKRPWQKFCSPACRRRHWGQMQDSDQQLKSPSK